MQKILLIIILSITSKGIYSQESNRFFPENIQDTTISEYVKSIVPDEKTIRNEYVVLLDFIDECIAAFHENIATSFKIDKFSRKYPKISKGKLTICEEPTKTVNVWDNELQAHRLVPYISYVEEMLYVVHYMQIYNQLIDHWLITKNELLRNCKDIDEEIIKMQALVRYYENANTANGRNK